MALMGGFLTNMSPHAIGILVASIVLITGSDACSPSRRTPSVTTKPKTPAPTKRPTVNPSRNTSTTPSESARNTTSGSPPSTTSGSPSSTQSSTSRPGENCYVCFSTTVNNLTNGTIEKELDKLARSGKLSILFANGTENQSVFLKRMNTDDANCSKIQGYVINITRNTDTNYTHTIKRLSQDNAKIACQCAQVCTPFPPGNNTTTPKTTEPNSTDSDKSDKPPQQRSTAEPHSAGTIAAGKSDKDGIFSTIIVIPVTLVAILVIIVVILVFWFKRRATKKGYEEDKSQDSVDHVAGPLNGDMYTVVNPSTEIELKNRKGDNDLVYTELSHMKSGKSVEEHPESDETEYAGITHILKAGETTYENVTPRNDEEYGYANVVAV